MGRSKLLALSILLVSIVSSLVSTHLSMLALQPKLMVIEWILERVNGEATANAIPSEDDSMVNPSYKLLPFRWKVTAKFWINPSNKYGFSADSVVKAITAAAVTWDEQTSFQVFQYMGVTARSAGRYDGYNVVSWGSYRAGVIAVTYIWYTGDTVIETDTRLNKLYKWSLSGEPDRMDVQNIMTHEFGHWCGLDDLYDDKDYWLTMYGYASLGETYKRTLGLGDILGLQAVYGK
ncbi:MAG: hypothetical protein RMJ00_05465 [Nitrososphaerota archaeon]|nr:hypothetical protein [Candidatus Bathyarchaeota archaeon]MCX8162393.1 hypothetical protein [Candidatus Bathyarchaeota archaeon]MDW8062128.1 hypothetical protein [Nitrososphaerota archaeon]